MAKVLALFALVFVGDIVCAKDGLQKQYYCSRPVSIQQLSQCLMHLTVPGFQFDGKLRMVVEQQYLQQCCKQLSLVQQQCQCGAIQQVFDQARQEGGRDQMHEKLVKALRLHDDCNLKVQKCLIESPRDDYVRLNQDRM